MNQAERNKSDPAWLAEQAKKQKYDDDFTDECQDSLNHAWMEWYIK